MFGLGGQVGTQLACRVVEVEICVEQVIIGVGTQQVLTPVIALGVLTILTSVVQVGPGIRIFRERVFRFEVLDRLERLSQQRIGVAKRTMLLIRAPDSCS